MILKNKKSIVYTILLMAALTFGAKATEECFEGVSRSVFKFNMVVDDIILEPVAKGYNKLPNPIKKGTSNIVSVQYLQSGPENY